MESSFSITTFVRWMTRNEERLIRHPSRQVRPMPTQKGSMGGLRMSSGLKRGSSMVAAAAAVKTNVAGEMYSSASTTGSTRINCRMPSSASLAATVFTRLERCELLESCAARFELFQQRSISFEVKLAACK